MAQFWICNLFTALKARLHTFQLTALLTTLLLFFTSEIVKFLYVGIIFAFCISAHFTTDRSTNHTLALPQSSLKSQREQNTHLEDCYETVSREV